MILLREAREKKKMSQKQLSTLSGVLQQTISSIESGARRNPGVETLAPLARVLECKIDDLYVPEKEEQ